MPKTGGDTTATTATTSLLETSAAAAAAPTVPSKAKTTNKAVPAKAKKTVTKAKAGGGSKAKGNSKSKSKKPKAAAAAAAASDDNDNGGHPPAEEFATTNKKRAGIPSYYDLHEYFHDERKAVKFLMDHGIVHPPRTLCPRCEKPISFNLEAEFNIRCRSRACLRQYGKMWSESIFQRSCLFQSSKRAHVLLHFLYLWINGIPHKQIYIMLGWSTVTATTWIRYARQAVAESVVETPPDSIIGGEGTLGEGTRVEVGIVPMKSKDHDEWLLAGLERNSRRAFFAVRLTGQSNVTPEILTEYLLKFIRGGSTIISKEADGIPDLATSQPHKKYKQETFKDMIKKYPGETPMFEWIWRKQHEATLWNSLLDAMKDFHLTADQMKQMDAHNHHAPHHAPHAATAAASAAADGGDATNSPAGIAANGGGNAKKHQDESGT